MKADIHVVIGPWYAKDLYINHSHTILIDRCYYKGDPQHVSAGWMNKSGGRDFVKGVGKQAPTIKQKEQSNKTIFLADYNGAIEKADCIRFHPANKKSDMPLIDQLNKYGIAIGYKTTALVTAALEGLQIICKGENILNHPDWLEILPYADWSSDEIENGELWEHLQSQPRQLRNQ